MTINPSSPFREVESNHVPSSDDGSIPKGRVMELDMVPMNDLNGVSKSSVSIPPSHPEDLSKFVRSNDRRIPSCSSCSAADTNKLRLSIQVVVDYCVLYGFNPQGFKFESTLEHWQLCSMSCGWKKFLKYKLSAFMSFHLKGELPVCPFKEHDIPCQIAGGTLGRFIKLIMTTDRARSFATGILYLKKGFPRPDKAALELAKEETKKVLTTTQNVPTNNTATFIEVLGEIRRTVKEVFHGQSLTEEDLLKAYTPTVKANYTNSRSEYGTLGTLFEKGLIQDVHVLGPTIPFGESAEDVYSGALERDDNEERIEDEDVETYHVSKAFKERVTNRYRKVYEEVRNLAKVEEADVELVALAEALKERVISKGPALTYFTLKPIQKFLHRIMRKQRCFALIGKPVHGDFLREVFEREVGLFHSLDYQSATDLLNPVASAVCVDQICDTVGIPDDLRALFHKALTGHLVEGVPQLWGQLMGSVVSFIVLCLINAAVIRMALEKTTGIIRTCSDLPMVVNGDDGLVRAPDTFLPIWKDCAVLAGLKPSVGKVYSHTTYMNINSTSYELIEGKFVLLPYVNMGLIYGQTRSGPAIHRKAVADNTGEELSLGARHHKLIELCPENLIPEVHKLFLKSNWKILSKVKIPWYIPETLGGVGLSPLYTYTYTEDITETGRNYLRLSNGHVCGPSRLDVRIALSFLDKIQKSFVVKRVPTQQPIQARSVWQTRMFRNEHRARIELKESDATFMDLATYYLTPSLVMQKISEEKVLAQLHHNERAWVSITGLFTDSSFRGEDLFLDEYSA